MAEVNRVIDCWADQAITDKVGKHTLTLELTLLDELQLVSISAHSKAKYSVALL